MKLRDLILSWAKNPEPDFVIGGAERPYLRRWWLIPRNPLFNAYLHQFLRSDDDRAAHGHPWLFRLSWILDRGYIDWRPWRGNALRLLPKFLRAGDVSVHWGASPHRVQLYMEAGRELPCWTLFITGPRVREWGFYCRRGWVHWRDFTAGPDGATVGKGCDQ